MNKLKRCPFCGGRAKIRVCDAIGQPREDAYENDENNGWDGVMFYIDHRVEGCLIANEDEKTLGRYIYSTRKRAIADWNRRLYKK
jgi:hypothetical protein